MKEFFLKENSLEQISFPLMVKKVAVELHSLRSQRTTALESLCAVQPCNLAGFQTNLVFVVQLTCFPWIRRVSSEGGRQNKHNLFCVCAHSLALHSWKGRSQLTVVLAYLQPTSAELVIQCKCHWKILFPFFLVETCHISTRLSCFLNHCQKVFRSYFSSLTVFQQYGFKQLILSEEIIL